LKGFCPSCTRCLIGTRALLGEGWDAPAVNVVIDLTAATTPTSVVPARGRALRLDAGWPGKVADNWSVVCVTGDHPMGAAAFERAWNARVGPGSVVYAGSLEGTGILAAQRGDDPFALTTQIRTLWR
jgi:hypothetical protein